MSHLIKKDIYQTGRLFSEYDTEGENFIDQLDGHVPQTGLLVEVRGLPVENLGKNISSVPNTFLKS